MGGRYHLRMIPALIVVYALAVARVTRLITADKLTEAPRLWLGIRLWARTVPDAEAIMRRRRDLDHMIGDSLADTRRVMAYERHQDGADPPLGVYLLSCPWCASIYVAAVAAPAAYFWGSSPWLFVPALALAFSYVTGFLAGKE